LTVLAKTGKRRKKRRKSSFPATAIIVVIGILTLVTGVVLTLSREGYLGETGRLINDRREMLTRKFSLKGLTGDNPSQTDERDDYIGYNEQERKSCDGETGEKTANPGKQAEKNRSRLSNDRKRQPGEKSDKSGNFRETRSTGQPDKGEEGATTTIPVSRWKTGERDPSKPVVAIVIDDFGNSWNNVEDFCQLEIPITFAILPKLPYSERTARKALESEQEVILHLPMENHSGKNPGPGTITTQMSREDIIKNFEDNLSSVPGASGFNNHEGSKATEDEKLMNELMEIAKKYNLFFLDSRTSLNSVAFDAASRIQLMTAKRHVFLDNEDNKEYISGQLKILAEKAKKEGSAIGIGHNRKNTCIVIQEMIPKIKEENVDFIFVSELVK
jgi:uncharacterized protein